MSRQDVIKVEGLVRNYKLIQTENQKVKEIKVLKGLDFTIKKQ